MKEAVLLQPAKFNKINSAENLIYASIYVSIIVPIYNESESIIHLLDTIQSAMKSQNNSWELILVDDGSIDNTSKLVQEYSKTHNDKKIHLLELSRNYGQTAAMQAGIDYAKGEYIVTLDGDLQNDPNDIPHMIEDLKQRDLDLLVGWRKDRKDNALVRKVPSWLANKLIAKVSGIHLHDYGCSLKVYRGDVIRKIKLMGEMHRFIPVWVAGIVPPSRIGEIPVQHHARQFGKSKYGITRTIRVILDLLSVMFFRRYLARPGHFFGTIGLFVGLIGSLILSWLAIDKFILGHDIGTRPLLLVGVISILMSLQFITTGILAEMISRTYFNSSKNDSYTIRHIHTMHSAIAE